ncbi:uncharacterized protein ighd [Rhinichthys klamathensis goyatoka]|uniref:uncharacterized protein ighd n=1 Tax=Rhinichthys klamathensis goyatoka TaxID=3034132 RepID=UPI0024B59947|nr:uncharacterized protein ighd [Rhinichthys klamathensis goyatoka]
MDRQIEWIVWIEHPLFEPIDTDDSGISNTAVTFVFLFLITLFYSIVKRVTAPTIALLSKEEGDSIVLQCQLKDYYPDKLTVQWLSGDQLVSAAKNKMLQTTDKVEKTFTYISQISIDAKYEDKNYTCKASHNSKEFKREYSMCLAKSVFKPSVQVKRAHLRDILKENEVKISCIVEAPHNTEVLWLVDNRKKATRASKDLLNNIVSNLTLSRAEWLKLKTLVCTANHPCFPEESAKIQVADMEKNPVVVIRRTFKKSAQSGTALLECVVKDLPSGEVCINFQANQADISDFTCVDWVPSENLWSLTTHFTIPSEHQKKGNRFTCTVHRLFKSFASEPAGNFFDDPTIELVVVPSVGPFRLSSDPQRLLCSGKGFDLKIKWFSESMEKNGTALDVSMMENGYVKVYSEILVPQQEWDKGVTYTCQIVDENSGNTTEINTSICAAKSMFKPSVQVKRAHLRDILKENEVKISCIVEAPHNTEVLWLVDNREKATRASKDLLNKIVSNLTLSRAEWLKLKTLVCTANHPCFPEESAKIQVADMEKNPVVVIRRTFKKSAQSGTALLECVVKDLPSGEVCINFQANQADISDFTCVDWVPSENLWSLTTHFTIPNDPTIELVVVPSVGPFRLSSDPQRLLCSGKGFDLKIKWFSESVEKNGTALDVSMMENGYVKVYSEILVPQQEWDKGVTYTCQIVDENSGKTTERNTSICAADMEKNPVVVIRRTFKKSAQSGTALLECVVKDLPSGEVCINFQANQADISDFTCVDWFPLDDPTIELVVVPSVGPFRLSSDPQRLLCSGKGFDLKIKWFSESMEKNGTALDVSMMENGYVKVYSEILVPQQEWDKGVTYTCQIVDENSGKTTERNTSICAGKHTICDTASSFYESNFIHFTITAKSVFKPSVQVKRAHLRDILKENEVKISCIVEAPHNTEVLWLVDNREKATRASKDLLNKIVSNLTLSRAEWLKLKTLVCTANHPCFPEESAKIQVADMEKNPVVVIRRTFKKSAQSGTALLECVVKDLPSGEVCINFQANQADISDFTCVDWVPSENLWSLTTHFTIPSEHQKKGNRFTCTVHRLFKSFASEPAGNFFDDPTIELVVVPSVGPFRLSSDPQRLLCSGKGFDLKIKWFSESVEKNGTALDVSMMENGYVKVYSEILVPQQEWDKGVTYTCQIVDENSGKTTERNTSICAVIAPSSLQTAVYLHGPLNHVRYGTALNLTCLVVGQNVKYFSLQWKRNGISLNPNSFDQTPIDHANGTQSKKSVLEVTFETWKTYAVFTCEVKHLCSNVTQQENISKNRDPKQPTVRILRPSDSDLSGQNTSLLCFITGFFPSDISVQWQLNGTQFNESHFTNSPVVAHTSGGFSMHSALILPASQWREGVYSCIVYHESSQSPFIANLENLYASLIHSAPSAKLLQGASELVCLAYGFSPPVINITWLLGMNEVSAHNDTNPAKGPDGKFSIRSHLQLLPSDWAPGEVYTCRVTHETGTQLLNISKKSALFEEAIFMNENKPESIVQDTVEEIWNMACAFLALFLLSLLYGCTVTLVKMKPK